MDAYIRCTKKLISDEQFQEFTKVIEAEISAYEREIENYRVGTLSDAEIDVLNLFEKYIGIEELSNEMLTDMIKSIYVYNEKRVKIVWNFKERLRENCVLKKVSLNLK